MDFLLRSGTRWSIGALTVAEYQDTFRRVAVVSELRKAQQWLVANPSRRKTERGMLRFLNGWLAKEDARGTRIREQPMSQPWHCPHTPACLQRWHCAKRDEFERVKAEVIREREARI